MSDKTPAEAAKALNDTAAEQHLNLKFEVVNGVVQAKIPEDTAKAIQNGTLPSAAELLGNPAFQPPVAVAANSVGGKLANGALGGIGGHFGIGGGKSGNSAIVEDHVIKVSGPFTDASVAVLQHSLEHNAAAIKPAVEKKPDINAASTELKKIHDADNAKADPHQVEVATKLSSSALTFKPENGAVVAHLTDAQAANLDKVLATGSGVDQKQLFGSEKITYDPKTKTVTAAGDISEKNIAAFGTENPALGVALGMGSPDIVKKLLQPVALLDNHDHAGPGYAVANMAKSQDIDKGKALG